MNETPNAETPNAETPMTCTWVDVRSVAAQSADMRVWGTSLSVYAPPGQVLVAVNQPKTTAQILALAVLKGEPCGRELVDCLIEQGIVDIEAEVVRKARAEERMAVAREIEQEPLSRLFDDGGRVWRDAAHFIRRGIQ
jgi:hypothetical protein